MSSPRKPDVVTVVFTALVGAASGSLGGPVFAVAGVLVGALWGLGLVWLARRLSRSDVQRRKWTDVVLFLTALCAGCVTGASFMGQLLMSTALNTQPQFFADLIRGPIGVAEALPFYLFNTPIEVLLAPLAVLLVWNNPRRRRLILAVVIVWGVHRVWTYTWFVPLISEWSTGASGTPMTAAQLAQARTWVDLSWIRCAFDITATVLVLLAALVPGTGARPPAETSEPAGRAVRPALPR